MSLYLLLALALAALTIWPSWMVARRAGYHGVWSVLMMVPLLNIVTLYVFAFSRWPIDRAPDVTDVFD